jgi:hypothetical protein
MREVELTKDSLLRVELVWRFAWAGLMCMDCLEGTEWKE